MASNTRRIPEGEWSGFPELTWEQTRCLDNAAFITALMNRDYGHECELEFAYSVHG